LGLIIITRSIRPLLRNFQEKNFIGTETVSALQTRGHYDMPSDSIRRWPSRWDKPVENANDDLTCSAYENCSAPWGSTHEETLKEFLKYDFASGMYIWTGFDYIGELPHIHGRHAVPYFGIIDWQAFQRMCIICIKVYLLIKMCCIFFRTGTGRRAKPLMYGAYYNHSDEVELFLNGKSLGVKKEKRAMICMSCGERFSRRAHSSAVSRKDGKVVMTKEIKTAVHHAKNYFACRQAKHSCR
jgi:beta-galactosidase